MVIGWYNIFDLLLMITIVVFTYISYKKKIYMQIFEYFKIFFIITASAKLSSYTALYMQKFHITKADTYTTLILLAFFVNFLFFYFSWKSIFKVINQYINSNKIKTLFAKFFTFVEVVVIATFSFYVFMQIYITKIYLHKIVHKTYSYPKIQKFYNSFLNDDFVNMVLSSDTGTNHKEIIFKSFKNAL